MPLTTGKPLFIGRPYIDFTFVTDEMPEGDEKKVATDHAVSFGGGAVVAAFCCAKLGCTPDLLTTVANDWLGRMFRDMASHYGIQVHDREVSRSAFSFVRPHLGERTILRARDDEYLHPVPDLDIANFCAVHTDGHQPDAAIRYAKSAREHGNILTSLDAGSMRSNTIELLEFIDVGVASLSICEKLKMGPAEVLQLLRKKGCKVGAVTLGERGLVWYDQPGVTRTMSAPLIPPDKVVDSNGAGDVFHGAYMFSYIRDSDAPWEVHFRFASFAAAHSVQFLGIEAGLPTLANIEAAMRSRPVAVGE